MQVHHASRVLDSPGTNRVRVLEARSGPCSVLDVLVDGQRGVTVAE